MDEWLIVDENDWVEKQAETTPETETTPPPTSTRSEILPSSKIDRERLVQLFEDFLETLWRQVSRNDLGLLLNRV